MDTRKRVLLVDDETDFLDVMSQRIETWGFSVTNITTGKEAVEAVRNKDGDIMVLDYMMPEMDGIDVAASIREIDPEYPIIMFTAHPDNRALEGAERLGVAAFIPKFSSYSDSQTTLKNVLTMAARELSERKPKEEA